MKKGIASHQSDLADKKAEKIKYA